MQGRMILSQPTWCVNLILHKTQPYSTNPPCHQLKELQGTAKLWVRPDGLAMKWTAEDLVVCFKAADYLAGHSVRPANLVAPVSASYRYHWQFGQNDSTSNCCCHFFGTLHTQANMSIWVANSWKKKYYETMQLVIKITASYTNIIQNAE